MKLEKSLKYFNPQGAPVSDTRTSASPEHLTRADVMYAIGTTGCRARFGLATFLGKAGVSRSEKQQAIQALARHAIETAPKNVRKAAGTALGRCCLILAQFAFAEYSRSAATSVTCNTCGGSGFTSQTEDVVKYPGIFSSDGVEIVPPKIKHETVKRICVECNGKGKLKARCRCGGRGVVLGRLETKERGAPVYKVCERCSGKGFTDVPSTAAYKVILRYVPDLHVRTWTRNWRPFYEHLVDICWRAEKMADSEFQQVTAEE
ncbi:antitermination protein [Salmonella enterica]|uniref:Antitermination protein n=1 Tax=Salmonella enterica I TaxID=59201 RepID=A0A3R1B0B1_SALET|nr:antitermination protein [Salmonella enterica]EAS0615910.1 antitermination protein [Salmonella enterica subsp. enterica serovar Dahomey]EBZ5140115.1 antitermination protein [Salmonella enterica subsp. enterica serovar Antsalova]ECD6160861.1 antitermination protein [Salmonella enterica subsp. enterica]ECU7994139.1 antitermination protein [Salmonella enterica subsp. enterica serovar Toucra]EDX3940631.1 antitermination protein [Salmonella enterica subsp. enterica serovar Overschie]EDX6361036.1